MEKQHSRPQAEVRPEGGRSILERCKEFLSRVALRVVLGERKVLCERCKRPLGEKALGSEVVSDESSQVDRTSSLAKRRKISLIEAVDLPDHEKVVVLKPLKPTTRAEQEAWLREVSRGRLVFVKP